MFLVEVVANFVSSIQINRRRVDGILRDWNHHTRVLIRQQGSQDHTDASRSPVGQKDILGVGRNSVALFQEVCHIVAQASHSLAVRIGSRGSSRETRFDLSGPTNGVGRKELGSVGMIDTEFVGQVNESEDLSWPLQRLLSH